MLVVQDRLQRQKRMQPGEPARARVIDPAVKIGASNATSPNWRKLICAKMRDDVLVRSDSDAPLIVVLLVISEKTTSSTSRPRYPQRINRSRLRFPPLSTTRSRI